MNEFERQVLSELSVLQAQMKELLGIGQPGRLHRLEERVDSHEQSVQRLKGLGAAFGALLTLAHVVIAWLGGRH
ncbi:MAG TPA: hypothetical protein VMD97_08845 [Candidatus Aquilonibacter sp.]|nr:hypothetical protein [Candidatus Aquilonibacter sp.]